jgi:hypothetical protein
MSSEHSNSNSIIYKNSEPSICIPRAFNNITWKKVKETFEELFGDGCVERVDVVKKQHDNGDKFNRIFVHFKYWSAEHEEIRQRFLNGEELKIVYEEPWFWKCSMSRVEKPTGQKRGERRAPYITSLEDQHTNGRGPRNLEHVHERAFLEHLRTAPLAADRAAIAGRAAIAAFGGTAAADIVSKDHDARPECCSPRKVSSQQNVTFVTSARID